MRETSPAEQKNQYGLSEVELKELENNIVNIEKQAQKFKGKEVVLVVGKTGSGKSTTINYLQERKLKEVIDQGGNAFLEIDADQDTFEGVSPAMSAGIDACTTIATPYACIDSLYFCDTAGFSDPAGIATNLANHIAVQSVIKNAAAIKGIIFVIQANSISSVLAEERAQSFKSMVETIYHLVGDPTILTDSVAYVFTKVIAPGGGYLNTDSIRFRLRQLVEGGDSGDPEKRRLLERIKAMELHPRLYPVSGVDEGEMRNQINNFFINHAKTISKDQLHLSVTGEEKAVLFQLAEKIAVEFNQYHQEKVELLERREHLLHQINKNEENIDRLAPQVSILETIHQLQFYIENNPTVIEHVWRQVGVRRAGGLRGLAGGTNPVHAHVPETRPNPAIPAKQAEIARLKEQLPPDIAIINASETNQLKNTKAAELDKARGENDAYQNEVSTLRTRLNHIEERLEANEERYQLVSKLDVVFNFGNELPVVKEFLTKFSTPSEPTANSSGAGFFSGGTAMSGGGGGGPEPEESQSNAPTP